MAEIVNNSNQATYNRPEPPAVQLMPRARRVVSAPPTPKAPDNRPKLTLENITTGKQLHRPHAGPKPLSARELKKLIYHRVPPQDKWIEPLYQLKRVKLEQLNARRIRNTMHPNLKLIDKQLKSKDNALLGPNLGSIWGCRDNRCYKLARHLNLGADDYNLGSLGTLRVIGNTWVYNYHAKCPERNPYWAYNSQQKFVSGAHESYLVQDIERLKAKLRAEPSYNADGTILPAPEFQERPNRPFGGSLLTRDIEKAKYDPYQVYEPVDTLNFLHISRYKQALQQEREQELTDARELKAAQEYFTFKRPTENSLASINYKGVSLDNASSSKHQVFGRPWTNNQYNFDNRCFVLDKNGIPLMPLDLEQAQCLMRQNLGKFLEHDVLQLCLAIDDALPCIAHGRSYLEQCFALPLPPNQLSLVAKVAEYVDLQVFLNSHLLFGDRYQIPATLTNYSQRLIKEIPSAPKELYEFDLTHNKHKSQNCKVDVYAYNIAANIQRMRKLLPLNKIEIGVLNFNFEKLVR